MAGLIPITIPKWGIEMEHGTIAGWRVAPGDAVAVGDELVDIETDKIVNSFEATDAGTLVRILADEGEDLPVGALIGVLATVEVSEAEIDAFIASLDGEPVKATPTTAERVDGGRERVDQRGAGTPLRISPALRRKAERLGLDPADIPGSGYGGRILRDDIEAAKSGAAAVKSGSAGVSLRPLAGAQKTVAERMTLAKQTVPHFYLQRDCDMELVLTALQGRGADAEPVSVTHHILRAVGVALERYPALNVQLLPGGVRELDSVEVGLAVDTGDSLLTPVVRGIDGADLESVARTARDLVSRTRERRLEAVDLEGGAITVSNLGMLGVDSFNAIINPPQVMILAVGAIRERLSLRDGEPAMTRYCSLSLACDHRVINGAAGARFLGAVCEVLEAE
jgi:pyruvate dehydrogenase E2 component (dihydrolipoamide acetyltransferase)